MNGKAKEVYGFGDPHKASDPFKSMPKKRMVKFKSKSRPTVGKPKLGHAIIRRRRRRLMEEGPADNDLFADGDDHEQKSPMIK